MSDIDWNYRPPLAESRNIDGRPVWEPPVLAYTELIDEDYDKKREAALRYTSNDVAKATVILDTVTELELLVMYHDWLQLHSNHGADKSIPGETRNFYDGLYEQVEKDRMELSKEWYDLGLEMGRDAEGKWGFVARRPRATFAPPPPPKVSINVDD